MNIEFINEHTVKISASMDYDGTRPPLGERNILRKSDIAERFNKKHRGYKIKKISGPEEICDFRGESNAKGEWILTVVKLRLKSDPAKHPVKKTVKKGA
jgi:hypothetical protein